MLTDKFIIDVQRFVAISAVGVSALRHQGAGILKKIHEQLGFKMDLSEVGHIKTEEDFRIWLDRRTDILVRNCNAKWGAARKAINLFLRDCLYNKYLSKKYQLDHLEPWLEIPLDSVITKQLKKYVGRGCLPLWQGLIRLNKIESRIFQDYARQIAAKNNLARVHLDVSMWVNNR